SRISYGELALSATSLHENDTVTAGVHLQNHGPCEVEEVVQCYVLPPRGRADAPRATLVEFQRVSVPAHGRVQVEFTLRGEAFRQVLADGRSAWLPGHYQLQLGSASPGARAVALGAPAPAVAGIELR